jgi:hypothetical protein
MEMQQRTRSPDASHSTGIKLIRVSNGEVVAAYANVSISMKKKGKMSFLMSEKNEMDLGFKFQLMAIMSVLLILEVQRRRGEITNAGAVAYI